MASIMPYYNDLALYTDVPNSIGEDNLLPNYEQRSFTDLSFLIYQ